jgi:agmatine/peptidylarginine deiminase
MPGPTLQQKLEHLTIGLAEAEREYAAGVLYPDHDSSWPERIAAIKQHIADVQEMIANE